MPFLKVQGEPFTRAICQSPFANRQRLKAKGAFSLVEILLSLFFIIALVGILFSVSGSLFTRRKSNLQSVAAKVATKQIEFLRDRPFSVIGCGTTDPCVTSAQNIDTNNNYGTCSPCNDFGDTTDLSSLPNVKTERLVMGYGSPADKNIKQVTVTITWNDPSQQACAGTAQCRIIMDTLIYKDGL